MKKIFNTDNQIDRVADRQIDSPAMNFTTITRRSRLFSVPYTGPVFESITPIGLPNITVATTEVIQISNYPLLNGIYTKGYDESIGTYFMRDDGEYYVYYFVAFTSNWRFVFTDLSLIHI